MLLVLYYFEKLWHQNYDTADVTAVFVNMVFSDKDKIMIKNLYQLKGYRLAGINKFTSKQMMDKK